jgi:hypothetical protein
VQLPVVFVLLMHGIPLPFDVEQRYRRDAMFDRARPGRILPFIAQARLLACSERPAKARRALPALEDTAQAK